MNVLPFQAAADIVVSRSPDLEPLAGAGLAISLAYLNLERFRYRKRILGVAREKLAILEEATEFESIKHMDQARLLQELASIPDGDPWGETPKLEKNGGSLAHFWKAAFKSIFASNLDRVAVIVAAGVSLFALYVGVQSKFGIWPWLEWLFEGWRLGVWPIILLVATLLPILAIAAGNKLVRELYKKCADAFDQLEKAMATQAKAARLEQPQAKPAPDAMTAAEAARSALMMSPRFRPRPDRG